MCGVIGIAADSPIANRHWLTLGRESTRHRGRDEAGEWWSGDSRLDLGHRRLAILDPSPAGFQPMHDPRGEIHNCTDLRRDLTGKGHPFRSETARAGRTRALVEHSWDRRLEPLLTILAGV